MIRFPFRLALLALLASPVILHAEELLPSGKPASDEMMKKAQELSKPNENHRLLASLEGKWTHTLLWWNEPNTEPKESEGTNTNTMIMDGRFLKQDVSGESMGAPFQGMGMTGYDNVRKEFVSTWLDSRNTGIMTASGSFDAKKKIIHENIIGSCPMTGDRERKVRAEWKFMDNDHYTYAMFEKAPDGKEFKAVEIRYTRVTG